MPVSTMVNFVNELKRFIELRDKYLSDERTRIEGARAEEIREGIKESVKKFEHICKINIAEELLKEGKPLYFIEDATGLDRREIIRLEKNMDSE
ncbi:hypothetical protein [Bacillus sp. NPDC094106]|uniref:hypothetical protein n=1 Tax=Bacillus sp. NPDC094106 TaxID=3363949 RepID=UPI00380E232E